MPNTDAAHEIAFASERVALDVQKWSHTLTTAAFLFLTPAWKRAKRSNTRKPSFIWLPVTAFERNAHAARDLFLGAIGLAHSRTVWRALFLRALVLSRCEPANNWEIKEELWAMCRLNFDAQRAHDVLTNRTYRTRTKSTSAEVGSQYMCSAYAVAERGVGCSTNARYK